MHQIEIQPNNNIVHDRCITCSKIKQKFGKAHTIRKRKGSIEFILKIEHNKNTNLYLIIKSLIKIIIKKQDNDDCCCINNSLES